MPHNALVTRPPRSGKTTVVERVRSRLVDRGLTPGGVVRPEIREGGERVGFEIVDVTTGESRVLAHVRRAGGPSVGKYRINVPGVDDLCEAAFPRALESADFLVIDGIVPMEVHSDAFVRHVRTALDADLPVVAAVHYSGGGKAFHTAGRQSPGRWDIGSHRHYTARPRGSSAR